MKCIDMCCWGTFGARCCNIISLVGFIYFALNFIIFNQQKNFYEFHMQKPENTRWSMLICSILYLAFFIATLMRIFQLNRLKEASKKLTESINQNPKLLQVNSSSISSPTKMGVMRQA